MSKADIQHETARLAELKTKLHRTDKGASQWLSDVKEWAAGETSEISHASQGTTHKELQQSFEGLYLSVMLRKQTLYRQNDSSKLRHRLRRKLAEDKKLLLQEIQKYNDLVLDSATNIIDLAVVEHSLTGESSVSQIWPCDLNGSANISVKKRLHDQVMLTMRLQEERGIVVLEMAQHCTWLQSLAVALKNKMAEEDKGNEGLCCPSTSGVGNLFIQKSQTNKTFERKFSKEPQQSLHSCIRNVCTFLCNNNSSNIQLTLVVVLVVLYNTSRCQ
nr:uncharacterized protein LOC129437774 isoform X2 [Misgurnus anguillicaudatus]